MMEQMMFAQSRSGASSGTLGSSSNHTHQHSAAVQAINRAIMLSNQTPIPTTPSQSTRTSPNRFEIARAGQRVAVVTLDRPLHRLGETGVVVIEFAVSDVVCSSLRMTLETSEKVDPGLAVRSTASIARVSRKVYASRGENVLFGRRAVFAPTIPVLVSPTFITSGVELEWSVNLEFVTVKAPPPGEQQEEGQEEEEEQGEQQAQVAEKKSRKPLILEEVLKDERGTVEVAVESLDCDHFEVSIPITVYGDVVMDGMNMGDGRDDEVVGIPI